MQLEPDLSTTGLSPSRGYRRPSPRLPRFTLDRVIRFLLGVGVVTLVAGLIWYFAALIFYLLLGLVVRRRQLFGRPLGLERVARHSIPPSSS